MPELAWDQPTERIYEAGLDKGVLYLPDGSAVPWNGLTSVIETFDKETSPVYYDGMKINELVTLGDFSASMKAVTYPDEFLEVEGFASSRSGVFYADQQPQTFGLCYRTKIGSNTEGPDLGYKIHILYNVVAIPSDKTYASLTDSPSIVEFEWELTAIPEEVPGHRPTAHVIIDTRDVDPLLLEELEKMLYGSQYASASLIPMVDLVTLINEFLRFEIVDHGDGTWSAVTEFDAFVELGLENYFEINGINAWHLDDVTYQVTSTKGVEDVPQIRIYDVGDGTWTATTEYDALILEVGVGEVDILNANITIIDEDSYLITDTPED